MTPSALVGKMGVLPLAGEIIMLTVCAKHVVIVKAASNAASVYFIVVTIGGSLELVAGSDSYI